MDSLYWAKINKEIKFERTKKQYYSKYLWRIVYKIDQVRLINISWVHDVRAYVLQRQMEERRSHYAHHEEWRWTDGALLEHLRTIARENKERWRFRTEGNNMQVYAENEDELKELVRLVGRDQDIVSITSPTPGSEAALQSDCIIMPTMDYKYKVVLRDGNYDLQTKKSVLSQLKQRDDVKIPWQLERELTKRYPALWGAYFYTNDDSIVTMLALISPGMVGKIHPIKNYL